MASQGIRKEIAYLCRCLIYMAALRLCPAVKRRACAERPFAGNQGAGLVNGDGLPADKAVNSAIALFGKVLSSMPFSLRPMQAVEPHPAFEYELQDHNADYSVDAAAARPAAVRFNRRKERSRKTGFDLLRLTFNLARGDLDGSPSRC